MSIGKTNQAAWIESAGGRPVVVRSAPYHSPAPDEVMIRSHAVAINPVDWTVSISKESVICEKSADPLASCF
jgi:NADPH:quinone reductase-like Zn-dependent oxidoreductase